MLANNGVLDAYDIATGNEVYRQRLPSIGSGYSASPVAADGKIYLSSEDGDMLVVAAGPTFTHVATNTMNETLMATPALSEGVMYVRGASTLFAIGQKVDGLGLEAWGLGAWGLAACDVWRPRVASPLIVVTVTCAHRIPTERLPVPKQIRRHRGYPVPTPAAGPQGAEEFDGEP